MVYQARFEDVVAVFGSQVLLGSEDLRSFFDFHRAIHDGIPVPAFRHAVESLGKPARTVSEAIGISRSTFRRRDELVRLGFVDSERAVRLGFVIALGKVVLGSTHAVGRWLFKANTALGGEIPLRMLQTDVGARQVEAVLGRALLGAFS